MRYNIFYLLVVGLVAVKADELGLEGLKPSELKEIEKEIAAGNVPPNFTAEKPKRGVGKLSNTDSPNFNHLSSVAKPTYSVNPQAAYALNSQAYSANAQAAYSAAPQVSPYTAQSPYTAAQSPYSSPLRLVYSNQYVPSNQYLSYLQNPQVASQFAAQYYNPASAAAPHYLQTPTQIQYVSPPSYQHVPSAQYKALTSKTPVAQIQSTASQSVANQATSQVVLPSNMAVPYQQQQPFVMYLVSPQHIAAQQQQQLLYHPGQQQMLILGAQNPYLGLYNQHRFNLQPYQSPATASQLAYLTVPNAAQQLQQQVAASNAASASSDSVKQAINVQESSASSNAYGLRTKA